MSNLVPTESIKANWLQEPGEPSLWYRRFMLYYLPLGPSRNLTRAYMKCLEAEEPEKAAKKKASKHYVNAMSNWSDKSREWKWRERAEMFDMYNVGEYLAYVDQARETLMRNAQMAAQALVANLDNPRLGVAAAKEILDRVGLPSTHLVGVGKIEPYSADDLKKAEAEVADWENKIRGRVIDVDPQ